MDIWAYGCIGIWYLDIRIYGYMAFWIRGNISISEYGYIGKWMSEHVDIWLHDYITWMLGHSIQHIYIYIYIYILYIYSMYYII